MTKHKVVFLMCICVFGLSNYAGAQVVSEIVIQGNKKTNTNFLDRLIETEAGEQLDSTNIEVRYFKEHIKERYQDDSFNYSINDTGGVNLIQRVLRKFFNWLNDVFGFDINVDYLTLEYIVYAILGIGALYLLIRFLLQSPMRTVFKTESQTIDNFSYVEEDIEHIDFDSLINKAVNSKNYRLAIRYLYLKALKALTNKNIIEWHYDKTNSDYLNEIKDEKTKIAFKRISYIYDHIWYGEFPINELVFKKHTTDFAKINTLANG